MFGPENGTMEVYRCNPSNIAECKATGIAAGIGEASRFSGGPPAGTGRAWG